MSSYYDETPVPAYTLLAQADTNMDTLLTQSSKLHSAIELARYKARRSVTTEIKLLDTKVREIQSREYVSEADNELMLTLQARLSTLINTYTEMITPDINSLPSHVAWLNSTYRPFVETVFAYSKVLVDDKPGFGGEAIFNVDTRVSSFVGDQVIHLSISSLRAKSPEDKTRWADFLGHRIIKRVRLLINNSLIDEYNGELYNSYFETRVSADKKKAWMQCVGQELPMEGELMQDPVYLDYKEKRLVYNGLQTIKYSHDAFELFIPLLFWYNTDRKDAIYLSADTKVEIRVQFESENKLMTCVDIGADIYNEKYVSPEIIKCDLYSNHIFVNKEVEQLFVARLGFRLIRLHKFAELYIDKNSDSVDLAPYVKFAVEDITLYTRPEVNESGIDNLNTWWRNAVITNTQIKTPVIFKDISTGSFEIGVNSIKLYEPKPVFTGLKLAYNGSSPHRDDSHLFFTAFTPLVANDIVCGDNNMYYISYSMWGKQYQPMGYVNMSTARNIALIYKSTNVESVNPVKLYVHATAINFLVYDSNKATLSFST